METGIVSVVMAVYNGEKYIEEQLESILLQTRVPDEIIIVDDCSKDATVSIVKKIMEKKNYTNYSIVSNEKNCGYIQTFLKGISYAKGEFIFLSDQDDVWCKDKILEMTEIMENNKDVLALSSSFNLVDSECNLIEKRQLPFRANNNIIKRHVSDGKLVNIKLKEVIQNNISPGCTCVFRDDIKKILDEIDTSEMGLPHDWLINLCAAKNNGLFFYNKKLILYRQHDSNTIGLKKSQTIEDRVKMYFKLVEEKKNIYQILEIFNCSKKMLVFCENINNSYYERIEALRKKSMLKLVRSFLKTLFFYGLHTDNYYVDASLIKNE